MKLKPCPFCGGEVVRDNTIDPYIASISCSECGDDYNISDEQWNTRPLEDAARAEVLEEAVERIEDLQNNETYPRPLNWEKILNISNNVRIKLV